MACFCFGGKNGGVEDAGARPLPPLEPIKYIILGPNNSGRRTLAKNLQYSEGFRAAGLSEQQFRRIRLNVQISAARALLLGASGGRVPPEASKDLEEMVNIPLDDMVNSPEKEKQFLDAATAFAKLDSVFRACSRPGNPASRNVSTSFFLKAESMFTDKYTPSKMAILCSNPAEKTINDAKNGTAQHMDLDVPITILPDQAWEKRELPEDITGPYVVVITVPIDECVECLPRKSIDTTKSPEPSTPSTPSEKDDGKPKAEELTEPAEEKKDKEEKPSEEKDGEKTEKKEDGEMVEPSEKKEEAKPEAAEEKNVEESKKDDEKPEEEKEKKVEEPKKKKAEPEPSQAAVSDDATTTTTTTVPAKNRVLAALDAIDAIKDSKLITNALRIYVAFTHSDLFSNLYPKLGDIRGSFPSYDGPGIPQKAFAYIGQLFADKFKVQCQWVEAPLLDEGFVKNSSLPKILELVTEKVNQRLAEEKRRRAAQPKRKLKPGEGVVAPKVKESKKLSVTSGHVSDIGKRKTNEDAFVAIDAFDDDRFLSNDTLSYYGVYDGHGGSVVANLCSQHVHPAVIFNPSFPNDPDTFFKAGFAEADKKMTVPDDKSGATAATLIIFGKMLYFANLGDSECILVSRASKSAPYARVLLSQKHSVSDPAEKKRIQDLGGMIVFNRLFGTLAVSRAFGDVEFKKPGKEYVSIEPAITSRPLSRNDQFAIVACDGLWDKVTYDDAMREAARLKEAGKSPEEVARHLCNLTIERGSGDNVTIIVVYFKWS